MTSTHARPAAAGESEAQRQRLLLLNSVALRQAVAALDGFARRLGSALAQAAQTSTDEGAARALKAAAEHLDRERASFQRLFSDCLQQALEREGKTLLARKKSRLQHHALDLSLDSFEAMQRKVEIDNLAQSFDRANAEALAALRQGLGQWLGSDVSALANPFRAEVFLNATVTAWERFESDPRAQALLLRQLGPDGFLPLDGLLAAVQHELDVHAPQAGVPSASSSRASIVLESERRLLARRGPALDAALEHLASTCALPAATLQLLQRLQPALRALAETDPRFLVNARHPGRRLVQLLIQASLAGGERTRPAATLQALVDRCAAQQARQSGVAALESACEEIDAHLAALLQAVDERREECIAEAMRQEREARAEQLARSEVVSRLAAEAVPHFVETFLLDQWVRVLAFAQTVHASKPALLPNLVQTMDDLIWSVQPKATAEERVQLAARLPALQSVLNAWLNVIKWQGPSRHDFEERLARCHETLLHPPTQTDPRLRLQDRVDALQRASEMDLCALENEQEEEALLPYMHRMDALAPGDWVEFTRNDGTTVQCRIAWVSGTRGRFVFIAPARQLGFAISEARLAQGLRAGRARITTTGEVLQGALAASVAAAASA